MFWRILGAIGIGIVLAMAILLIVTDGRPNVENRVPFVAVSDPVLEQERRAHEIALLQKETEITLITMTNTAELQMEKERVLQTQRLRNEISFTNMLDFFRWATVAGFGVILFIAVGLWLLRLILTIDNIIYSFLFAPTRISTIRQSRLIARENTPLLTANRSEVAREPSSPTGRERGTRNQEHGNRRENVGGNSPRNRPAHLREGGRTRMTTQVDLPEMELIEEESPHTTATIQVGEYEMSRAEYLQLAQALATGRETKSAIARRSAGRYQTNLQKLDAIIEHRKRYERNR